MTVEECTNQELIDLYWELEEDIANNMKHPMETYDEMKDNTKELGELTDFQSDVASEYKNRTGKDIG